MATQVKFPEVEARKNLNADGTPIEPTSQKFWRKLKEQPLVPIGSLATCGALVAASHYLRKGDRNQFQRALRWRVGLQGLTVVAAVIGTVYLGSGTPAQVKDVDVGESGKSSIYQNITTSPGRPVTVQQMERAEERKEQERAVLQQRLREAEIREESEQKRRAEEALLRPSGKVGSNDNPSRIRPVIGQDKRDRSVGTHNT